MGFVNLDVGAHTYWTSGKTPTQQWVWPDEDDTERFPTVAYTWDRVEAYTGKSKGRYKAYTNELDTLTHEQVNVPFLLYHFTIHLLPDIVSKSWFIFRVVG